MGNGGREDFEIKSSWLVGGNCDGVGSRGVNSGPWTDKGI